MSKNLEKTLRTIKTLRAIVEPWTTENKRQSKYQAGCIHNLQLSTNQIVNMVH